MSCISVQCSKKIRLQGIKIMHLDAEAVAKKVTINKKYLDVKLLIIYSYNFWVRCLRSACFLF